MLRLLRLLKIVFVVLRFGLDEFLLAPERIRWLRTPLNLVLFMRDISEPRAVRLRRALENLGPIFVKFGQMLSTRVISIGVCAIAEIRDAYFQRHRTTCPRHSSAKSPVPDADLSLLTGGRGYGKAQER